MSQGPRSEAALKTVLWLALGGWVGAWGFFAFVVSRIAFRILPGNVVGDMVGALLHDLHYGGAVAGLVVAGTLAALGRRGWVVGLPVVLAILSAASELFLSPAIAAIRPSTLGAASTVEIQTRFRLLHGLSLGLFMAIHLASAVLVGWIAWLDTRDRP